MTSGSRASAVSSSGRRSIGRFLCPDPEIDVVSATGDVSRFPVQAVRLRTADPIKPTTTISESPGFRSGGTSRRAQSCSNGGAIGPSPRPRTCS
jgi:hypothetical protein